MRDIQECRGIIEQYDGSFLREYHGALYALALPTGKLLDEPLRNLQGAGGG